VLSLVVRWVDSSGSSYDLSDVVSVNISKGDGLENNSCAITLRNDYTQFRPYVSADGIIFKTEQQIDVFVRYDTDGEGISDYSFDYLVFSGRVVEFECETTETGSPIKVKCADSSYIALNRVWLGVEIGTPPQLIKGVVDFVNQNIFDPNKRIIAQIERGITAISSSGVVTSNGHGLNDGEPVVLYNTNSTPSADGRWVVSSSTTNTFRLKSRLTGSYPVFSVAGTTGTMGGIQALNSAGGAYSSSEISKTGKPAYEVIKQLSQETYTLEPSKVPNRFHVDKWNSLRWFYPDDTVRHVVVEGRTDVQSSSYFHPVLKITQTFTDTRPHKVTNVKLNYAVYDIVNFIIFKAGQDLDNVQIQYFAYQDGSGTPINKDAAESWEDIARELKRREADKGNLTFVEGDKYTIAASTGVTSWGESYSSSSDYKEKFILEARRIALAYAQEIFNKTGNPRWQGSIEVTGEHSFDVNDTLIFSSGRHGIRNVFMRVTSVKHNISRSGWFTTLDLKEEVPRSII
jgi:hypothetical protein